MRIQYTEQQHFKTAWKYFSILKKKKKKKQLGKGNQSANGIGTTD